jgi:hypothetical protein
MKISASQRKALEDAGYTVGKSGSTVQSKEGGTVGGYNENGKVFSGNKVVRDILKGTAEAPKAAPKAAPKVAPKVAPKAAPKAAPKVAPKAAPKAKDAMTGYRKGDITTTSLDKKVGGRNDDAAEVNRRKTDTFVNTIKTAIDKSVPKSKTTSVRTPTAAEKRLAETTANLARVDAKVRNSKRPETTNPLILGARSIRNMFSGSGGLSDKKRKP